MFWPVQSLCAAIRVFGTRTSADLRSIGAIFSPAGALADTVDATLLKMGLLENTDSAPEHIMSTCLSTIKKDVTRWMVMPLKAESSIDPRATQIRVISLRVQFIQERHIMDWTVAVAATIWSGVCVWTLFCTVLIVPVLGMMSFPVICSTLVGLKTLRVLLAMKDATVSYIGEVEVDAKAWFSQEMDPYLLSWRTCIIDWTDVTIPQRANQMRYLLGELPRGHSLPTIAEEEETGQSEGEHVDDEDHEKDNLPAHLANITKAATPNVKRANSSSPLDISARTV